MLARPRVSIPFNPGDLVAYWRNQKWVNGTLQNGGQWYGVAVVLGQVGRNLIVVHRRQIFRCAPEQVRHATNEEKCLITTSQAELLGVKDMIEKGNLSSKQYVDLLPQSYPPQAESDEPDHASVPGPGDQVSVDPQVSGRSKDSPMPAPSRELPNESPNAQSPPTVLERQWMLALKLIQRNLVPPMVQSGEECPEKMGRSLCGDQQHSDKRISLTSSKMLCHN